MNRTPSRSALAALAVLLVAAPLPVWSDTLVIPAANEGADANSSIAFPFGVPPAAVATPYRFQQVYDGAAFGALGVITISALQFRVDQPTNPGVRLPINVQDLTVRLSSSSKGADQLASGSTAAFDSNLDGGDDTVVFSGPLSWDPCDEASCALPQFDLEIPFQTPFGFDPSTTNLVVDFVNLSETFAIALFDAAQVDADETSHVHEGIQILPPNDHNFVANSTGLVTRFVYTAPESDAALAGGAALLAITLLRRSRA